MPDWLLNSPNFSVIITNLDGEFVFVNEPFAKRYSFLGPKLVGESVTQSIHPEDLAKCNDAVQYCINNPGKTKSIILRKPEKMAGLYYSSLWDFTLLQDKEGTPIGIVSIGTDLTNTEIQSRRAKSFSEKLNEVLHSMIEGYLEVDRDWRVLHANDMAANLLNLTMEGILQKQLGDVLPLEQNPELKERLEKSMKAPKPATLELAYDGGKQWFCIVAHPSVDGLQLYLQDISERKDKEQKLQELLELTMKQNERLESFAQIVSHNLRSHTNNIKLLLSFQAQESEKWQDSELGKMMVSASNSLCESVTHLSEIATMRPKAPADLRPVSLNKTVLSALETLAANLQEQGITVHNELTEDYAVLAIPAYLDSIVLNLLSNAIKYKRETDAYIRISATRRKGFVAFAIVDNGLGIDLRRHEKKLFGMYRTFHEHPDAKGIGLFMTKNHIEALGGSIHVESEPSQGSTFTVFLPDAHDQKSTLLSD